MKKIEEILKKYQADIDQNELILLLAEAIKKNTAFVLVHKEYGLKAWEFLKFKKFLQGRKNNVPMAYLTGHKEFFKLDFYVNKHVLIPRPETEMIVDEAISIIKENIAFNTKILLIDVGTGSGCIPIAINQNMPIKLATFALDISSASLKVARKNAERYEIKINFIKSDLLKRVIKEEKTKEFSTIIITANLPYLTNTQFKNEPSIQHEPKHALVADDNGLALYKKMILQIKELLSKNSQIKFYILMEIDPDQTDSLNKFIKNTLPHCNSQTKTDLCGRDRLVIATNS